MAMNAGTAAVAGRRRHRRRPVMSEINVTPMVDVMLVLLIIFMVSAPLMTVGVPITLPKTQAKSLDQIQAPLAISITEQGKLFLQDVEVPLNELVPKLQAVTAERKGLDEPIFVRGDRKVDYDAVAKVMGRLQKAGFTGVTLMTLSEDGQ